MGSGGRGNSSSSRVLSLEPLSGSSHSRIARPSFSICSSSQSDGIYTTSEGLRGYGPLYLLATPNSDTLALRDRIFRFNLRRGGEGSADLSRLVLLVEVKEVHSDMTNFLNNLADILRMVSMTQKWGIKTVVGGRHQDLETKRMWTFGPKSETTYFRASQHTSPSTGT